MSSFNTPPTSAQSTQTGKRKKGRALVVFLISLVIAGGLTGITVWAFGPYWYPRFAGVQSQATVVAVGESTDSDGDTCENITVQFTDTHGRQHKVSPPYCIAGTDYHEDQTISIWYLPNDPEGFVTNGGDVGLAIGGGFLACCSLIALLWLLGSLLNLIAALLPQKKTVTP
jgi:hypothetical protein